MSPLSIKSMYLQRVIKHWGFQTTCKKAYKINEKHWNKYKPFEIRFEKQYGIKLKRTRCIRNNVQWPIPYTRYLTGETCFQRRCAPGLTTATTLDLGCFNTNPFYHRWFCASWIKKNISRSCNGKRALSYQRKLLGFVVMVVDFQQQSALSSAKRLMIKIAQQVLKVF